MFPPFRKSEHERLRELSSPYIDGRLSQKENVWVENHLEGCQECRAELNSLRGTVAVLQRLPMVPAPRSFALPGAPQRERWVPQQPLVWAMQFSTGVAALLLGLIVIGDSLQGTSPPPTSPMQSLAQEKAAVPSPAAAPRALAVPAAPAPAPTPAGTPASADSLVRGAGVAAPSPAPVPEKALGPQAAPEPSQPKGTGTQGLGNLWVLEVILGTLVLLLGGATGYLMLRARK